MLWGNPPDVFLVCVRARARVCVCVCVCVVPVSPVLLLVLGASLQRRRFVLQRQHQHLHRRVLVVWRGSGRQLDRGDAETPDVRLEIVPSHLPREQRLSSAVLTLRHGILFQKHHQLKKVKARGPPAP